MEQGKTTLTLRVALANSQSSYTRWTQLEGKGLKSPIALPSDECTGVATTRGQSCVLWVYVVDVLKCWWGA
jgi:hypothetical protein